ncbi:MAG: HAD hydrolase family protein [Ferruginibacter sp.]
MNVLQLFKNITCFVFDVDGVLTDGKLLLLDDGQMARTMNIKDGYALQLAVIKKYQVLIISGSRLSAAEQRLQRLGITDVHFNIKDKAALLQQFLIDKNLRKDQVLYMGDDIPDLEALQLCGLGCCPADAVPEVQAASTYISVLKGGEGCVRDVIEKTLKLRGDWHHTEEANSR